jgi:hypothetical protein
MRSACRTPRAQRVTVTATGTTVATLCGPFHPTLSGCLLHSFTPEASTSPTSHSADAQSAVPCPLRRPSPPTEWGTLGRSRFQLCSSRQAHRPRAPRARPHPYTRRTLHRALPRHLHRPTRRTDSHLAFRSDPCRLHAPSSLSLPMTPRTLVADRPMSRRMRPRTSTSRRQRLRLRSYPRVHRPMPTPSSHLLPSSRPFPSVGAASPSRVWTTRLSPLKYLTCRIFLVVVARRFACLCVGLGFPSPRRLETELSHKNNITGSLKTSNKRGPAGRHFLCHSLGVDCRRRGYKAISCPASPGPGSTTLTSLCNHHQQTTTTTCQQLPPPILISVLYFSCSIVDDEEILLLLVLYIYLDAICPSFFYHSGWVVGNLELPLHHHSWNQNQHC